MALMMTCYSVRILRHVLLHKNGSNLGLLIRYKHGSGRGSRRGQISDKPSFPQKSLDRSPSALASLGQEATGSTHHNEFDSQYFGNVLDKVPPNDAAVRTSASDAMPEVTTHRPSEEYTNQFDLQYFQILQDSGNADMRSQSMAQLNAASNQPGRTIKGHYMFSDIDLDSFDDINSSFVYEDSSDQSKPEKPGKEDGNIFDQQYFGKEEAEIGHEGLDANMKQSRTSATKFIDTAQSEEELYEQLQMEKRRQQAQARDERMREQTNVGSDKLLETHQTTTPYQQISSEEFEDHREVHLITSPTINKSVLDSLPPELRGKLIAQRKWQEKDQELQVSHHNISDLEDSVVSALKAVKKKSQKRTKPRRARERVIYGTEDKNVPVSSAACSGCGACLQCQDNSTPGFVPSEKFKELDLTRPLTTAVCQRCWYLIHRQTALNVTIPQDHYSDILRAVCKNHRALIILMVDLLDFPCSLIKNLKDHLGVERPLIIVGNKLDIIPKDEPKHEHRIQSHLLSACVEAGVCDKNNVKYVGLISAKTGYKVEDLISKIHSIRPPKGDVYLLGAANVGKSTLFNRLLESDLCKAKASNLMGRATISRWPGTTLNLLRFPLLHPTRERLALRAQRLKEEAENKKKEKLEQERGVGDKTAMEEDPRLDSYLEGKVGQTFKPKGKDIEPALPVKEDPFSLKLAAPNTARDKTKPRSRLDDGRSAVALDPKEFEMGAWFYDTPGVISEEQVLTLLTNEELKLVVPKKGILPRSLILKPGHTFFLGGLGRLDYIEGKAAIFATVFSSHALPIKVLPTETADAVYEEKLGTKYFMVPQGSEERMQRFPELISTDLTLQGEGRHKSAADVLFSSVGWAGITANQGMDVHLRVFTPRGLGCTVRQPSLVPYGFALRGPRRSSSSPFYNVNKKKLLMFMSR